MTPAAIAKRNRTRILLAFAAVYVIWGSTYLFIKYAIESVPPFMMGAARFTVAGALLYTIARWRGANKPDIRDWRSAAITGVLMPRRSTKSAIICSWSPENSPASTDGVSFGPKQP